MSTEALRVAVFGSAPISVSVFEAIRQHFPVVLAVISEEPRIRHGKTIPNPVQAWADSFGIPVANGATTPSPPLVHLLEDAQVDILFLLAYGRLLPSSVLDAPRHGSINLHPSPLPWYRGAAPIERQIMDGRTESAVSIIRMSPLLDRGELLAQEGFAIAGTDYRADVEASIVRVGIPLSLSVIHSMMEETTQPLRQVGEGSYARKLHVEDELIDWSTPAAHVYNLVRALSPDPCASTWRGHDRLRIVRATPLPFDSDLAPASPPHGLLARLSQKRAAVRCGDGWLELLEVQVAGKRPMPIADLLNGRLLVAGDIFQRTPST